MSVTTIPRRIAPDPIDGLPVPGKDAVLFTALGGVGEIGMNVYLYGYDGTWIMVDCGVSFPTPFTPGADVLVPDLIALEEAKDRFAGLVITHAHEDHYGAIGYLWDVFEAPIYASDFTRVMLDSKLRENGLDGDALMRRLKPGKPFKLGPFEIEAVPTTHSIPEPYKIVIRTPLGNVLHTGDWKQDAKPQVGPGFDQSAIVDAVGDNLLALVGDSTNVMEQQPSGSEEEAKQGLLTAVKAQEGRVAVVCFATNFARLQSLFWVAEKTQRRVALVGRSMIRVFQAAQESGIYTGNVQLVEPEHVDLLPREEVLLIVTGSQGEPRAALTRIAGDNHRDIRLEPGDTVIYSSRMIPGNELPIIRVQNTLASKGVHVVTDHEWDGDNPIHVSGHPSKGEVQTLYEALKPDTVIPVHGEARHLMTHALLGLELGASAVPIVENGDVLALKAPGEIEQLGQVETGKLAVDGERFIDIYGEMMRERRKLSQTGLVQVTLAVGASNRLVGPPLITSNGVLELPDEQDLLEDAATWVEEAYKRLSPRDVKSDGNLCEAIRVSLRRSFNAEIGRKPTVRVELLRVS